MSKIIDGVTYFTVTFLKYESTDLLGTCDVVDGEDATFLAPTPESVEGMLFTGWSADITAVKEDMTVEPVYKEVPIYYTVHFLNFEGNAYLSSQEVEEGNAAVSPAPEKISGYIFLCWDVPFNNVTSNITVRPQYRIIPSKSILNFYNRNTDNTTGALIKSYKSVNSCSINQKLSGECTIDLAMLTRMTREYVSVDDILEVEGLVFNITEIKEDISGGMCYTHLGGEHISYLLNNEEYKLSKFQMTGKVRDILAFLLSGTPFEVGNVDSENVVTLLVRQDSTRRACVMQLVALANCEIEYYGYTIGIRTHVGNESRVDLMKMSIIQDISYSYNASEETTNYTISLYQKGILDLGDELKLTFAPMNIDSESRIVGIEWNPFNYKEVNITIGDYIPTINDTLMESLDEGGVDTHILIDHIPKPEDLTGNNGTIFLVYQKEEE